MARHPAGIEFNDAASPDADSNRVPPATYSFSTDPRVGAVMLSVVHDHADEP